MNITSASQDTIWIVIDDFDHNTEGPALCTVCGSTSEQGHVVFRPPVIQDYSGFNDVCQKCIEQAAHVLGFASPEILEAFKHKNEVDAAEIKLLKEEARSSNEALAVVVRENVKLQDQIEAMTKDIPLNDDNDYALLFDDPGSVHQLHFAEQYSPEGSED